MRKWEPICACIALVVLQLVQLSTADRVLAVPLPGAESHLLVMTRITQELVTRGHDVMIAIPTSDSISMVHANTSGAHIVFYEAAFSKQDIKELVRDAKESVSNVALGSLESFLAYLQSLMTSCEAFLQDATALEQLRAFDADILLGDVTYACSSGLSELLRRPTSRPPIPRILVSALPILDPLMPGRQDSIPNALATTPQMGTGLTSHMSLLERTANVLVYWGSLVVEQLRGIPMYDKICTKFDVDCWNPSVLRGAALFIYNMDWAVEYPRPLPPSVQAVGALLPRPARPVAPDFQAIMRGAGERGVVYASLGTLCNLGLEEFQEMGRGLSAMPTTVVWKLGAGDLPGNATVQSLGLADNVKVVEWAPQNDLLGDGRVRAFVTHGGLNSIYEAAYHGVPVVGVPVFGDQPDNCMKAVHHGFGLAIPPGRLTAAALAGAVLRVAGEPGFRAAAQRLSRRMQAHRHTPAEKAADWVEHVLATGGEQYLKTAEHRLPWHARNLLDVAVLLGTIAAAAAAVTWWATRAALLRVVAWCRPNARPNVSALELVGAKRGSGRVVTLTAVAAPSSAAKPA